MGKEDNTINYFNKSNQRIKDFLNEIIEDEKPIVSGEVEMADGTEDIYVGRTELAETLLQKLDEWDEEDEENEN